MALQLPLERHIGVGASAHRQQHLPGKLARRQANRGSFGWGGECQGVGQRRSRLHN